MSVRFDQSSGDQVLEADGSALAPSFTNGGFSVSVWVKFESFPSTGGIDVVWWYGDASESDVFVRLELLPNSGMPLFRATCGDGYSSGMGVAAPALVLEEDTWYLVTFTAEHDSGVLTHTLYISGRRPDGTTVEDDDSEPETQSAPTAVADFDRFTLARLGNGESPSRATDCLMEQAAIWNRVLTQDEHDTMFADDEPDFDGLPRSPSVVGVEADATDKGIAWWLLAGHFRHDLKVDPSRTLSGMDKNEHITVGAGDLYNESSTTATGDLPFMLVPSGENSPRWSANSPNVFFPAVTYSGTLVEHRAQRQPVTRMSPACFFYARPEEYETSSEEGEHPVYDDPFCRVFARISANNTNKVNRNPPYFLTGAYTPASYITNVARRVADWFEFQGMFKGKGGGGGGDFDGCIFITGIGTQTTIVDEVGNWGRDIGDTPPTGAGTKVKGRGIPIHEHPRDELTQPLSSLDSHVWDNLYHENGSTLVRGWFQSFFPALKGELDRRNLCHPARMHLDVETMPLLNTFVRGGNGGNWSFTKYTDPSAVTVATSTRTETRWDGEIVLIDTDSEAWTFADMWSVGGLSDTIEATGWPTTNVAESNDLNVGWREWLLSWSGAIDVYALWVGMGQPGKDTFGDDFRWSNYYRVIADNEAYPFTMHTYWRTYVSSTTGLQADYSSPNLYPPPAGNIDEFIEEEGTPDHLKSVSRRDVFHRVCRARIDACVNALHPKPLVPWLPGVGWTRETTSEVLYTLNEPDIRLMMWYAWQRGANEFCFWINSAEAPESDSDPDGEPGHLEQDESGLTDEMGAVADFDATYRVARGVINAIRTCPVYSRDRSMRHCKAWR